MMTEGQILCTIEALQQTRDYADEVESVRLTAEIDRLLELLERIEPTQRPQALAAALGLEQEE